MEFGILGPPATVPRSRLEGRSHALLAMLLLEANAPGSRDSLVAGMWGERPPPSAAASLDSCISRLRRILGAERLRRRPAGYELDVRPGEPDLDRFDAAVERARHAAGPAETAQALREALATWRGPALADVLFERFAAVEADASRDDGWQHSRRGSMPSSPAGGELWVANQFSGTLSRVDPRASTVTLTVRSGGKPTGVAAAGTRVWAVTGPGPGAHCGGP